MTIGFPATLLVLLAVAGLPVHAATLDGVAFDDARTVGSSLLVLNGVGKRVVLFFDAYHAALYLPRASTSLQDIAAVGGPRQLDIRLLRDVRLSLLEDVLVDGIGKNMTPSELAPLKPAMQALLETMRRIKAFRKGDLLQLTFTGEATQVALNGVVVGEPIGNAAFNNALLSIWLGRHPIDADLKASLLGAKRPEDRAAVTHR